MLDVGCWMLDEIPAGGVNRRFLNCPRANQPAVSAAGSFALSRRLTPPAGMSLTVGWDVQPTRKGPTITGRAFSVGGP